jgi:hypothetical protein
MGISGVIYMPKRLIRKYVGLKMKTNWLEIGEKSPSTGVLEGENYHFHFSFSLRSLLLSEKEKKEKIK